MLNLIPTPNFAEISETKTLNVKSIVINEADINRDVIDDFHAFLSKINIQNGNGSQKNTGLKSATKSVFIQTASAERFLHCKR